MSRSPDYGGRRTPLPGAVKPQRHHERIARLGVGALHPACRAAYHDGGTPCGRCSWILGIDNDGAVYTDAHLDDEDDEDDLG